VDRARLKLVAHAPVHQQVRARAQGLASSTSNSATGVTPSA
jgi:hypothetical protein